MLIFQNAQKASWVAQNALAGHMRPTCLRPLGKPLRKLENWLSLGTKIRTAAEQTIVCLDAKGLWKPGQSFILAGLHIFCYAQFPEKLRKTRLIPVATFATVLFTQQTATPS